MSSSGRVNIVLFGTNEELGKKEVLDGPHFVSPERALKKLNEWFGLFVEWQVMIKTSRYGSRTRNARSAKIPHEWTQALNDVIKSKASKGVFFQGRSVNGHDVYIDVQNEAKWAGK